MAEYEGKTLNTDYYLWKDFKEGGEDSFYKLYDNYADILFRFGMHFSRDQDFIKDCIHDLFLDLYKYRKKLSMTDSIRFYLLRSLRRKIHQEKVKTVHLIYTSAALPQEENIEPTFEDSMIATETEMENAEVLKKAMKKLSPGQREALSLKFEHNLTYPEIAEMLNMSVESARTAIYRALKLLRKSLKKDNVPLLFFLLLSVD
jgi:RNA polymerase sigma factor (sigma-70 family)